MLVKKLTFIKKGNYFFIDKNTEKIYNTYNTDGLDAVEKNYEEQFGGTDVGIAFHDLNMMRKLNPAGIEGK